MSPLGSRMVIQAFRIYLERAYPSGRIPENRCQFASLVDSASLEEILHLKGVETIAPTVPGRTKQGYAMRIGNEWYPHMKVVLLPLDESDTYIFSVDTHDHVTVPAGSPDEEALRALKARNIQLAQVVEKAWTEAGIPTQAAALREYMDRTRR